MPDAEGILSSIRVKCSDGANPERQRGAWRLPEPGEGRPDEREVSFWSHGTVSGLDRVDVGATL